MAVLNSPNNNGTNSLWASRAATSVNATSNRFYLNEHQLINSNLNSFGINYDHTLDPNNYRFIGDVHKEENSLLGEILPSTLTNPNPISSRNTFGSNEWEQNFTFQNEFFMLANLSHFNMAPNTNNMNSFFRTSRNYSKINLTNPSFYHNPESEEISSSYVQPARQSNQSFSNFFFSNIMNPFERLSNNLSGL